MSDSVAEHGRPWSVLAIATIASWVVLVWVWFSQNVVYGLLWVLGIAVIGGVGAVAAALSIAWAIRSLLDRRYVLAAVIVVVAGGIGAVVLCVPWGDAYGRIWFALHRDAFVRVEAQVASGQLDPSVDYYGADLADADAGISITGRVSASSDWMDEPGPCSEPIEFIPATVGIPDGGVGFIHLPCDDPPRGFMANGYDDGIIPRIRLGDGWWWADGNVPDGYFDE